MKQLKTGDILLFSEHPSSCWMHCLDLTIKCCTCSKYSHSAIVVKDPPWAPHLKGMFVWESSWHGTKDPQDNEVKFGVQLTPITFYTEHYPGKVSIFVREYNGSLFNDNTLKRIHKHVYKHKYDDRARDWVAACFRKNINRQTDVFTCSAFVSYILTSLGILKLNTNWTIVRASDLSSVSTYLEWNIDYEKDKYIGSYQEKNKINYTKKYTLIEKPLKE